MAGCGRVAGSADNPEVSMQVGSGSKDAWVMAEGPVEAFSLLPPPSRPVALTRGSGDLPSQTADNLFWLGRYAERAEGIARLARVLLRLLEQGPAVLIVSDLLYKKGGLLRNGGMFHNGLHALGHTACSNQDKEARQHKRYAHTVRFLSEIEHGR